MAVSPSAASPAPSETKPENPDSEKPSIQSNQQDPSLPPPPPPPASSSSSSPSSVITEIPNSNSLLATPQPPLLQSFAPSTISPAALPPSAPSFRPVTQIPISTPHFSPLPNPNMQNPNFQNPNVQPPGVNPNPNPLSIMLPGVATGVVGAVSVSVSQLRPGGMYQPPPGQQPLHPSARPPYAQIPNGYAMPPPPPQGTIPPPVS